MICHAPTAALAVAVVDASAYSSGDLFAFGWADNQIGRLVVVGHATSADSADVWTSGQLGDALASTAPAYGPLPGGAGFTAAIRSERADGIPTEDLCIGGMPGTLDESMRFASQKVSNAPGCSSRTALK
jgi:hypothetical protein